MPRGKISRRRRSSKRMMGGEGDESWARSVYGDMGEQKAGNIGNVIAMNPQRGGSVVVPTVGGGAAVVPTLVGGNEGAPLMKLGGSDMKLPDQVGGEDPSFIPEGGIPTDGGGIITDVAVPAVMLFARDSLRKRRLVGMPNIMGKTNKKYYGRRKFRRGSRKFRR